MVLTNLIIDIPERIVIQYGDTNRLILLDYPVSMIGDTTSPQISSINSEPSGSGSYTVTWDTNEFAVCSYVYGSETGVYTNSIDNNLFYLHHQVSLTNLALGSTVYYQISCTDRSGNIQQTVESSMVVIDQVFIYLPQIIR